MIYNNYFRPIAQPGDYIEVVGAGGKGFKKIFKIVGIEPLPLLDIDLGALTAGTSKEKEMSELYLNVSQLAQFRIRLIDDFKLIIKQPQSDTKYTTKQSNFYISRDIAGTDFVNLTEFYQYEDQTLIFEVINDTTTDLASTKLQISGFKYLIEEIDQNTIVDVKTTVYVETL